MNLQPIINIIEENVSVLLSRVKFPFSSSITQIETPYPHLKIMYSVIISNHTIHFNCNHLYVQIQINDGVFQYGDGFRSTDMVVASYYAHAFIRIIDSFIMSCLFNKSSTNGRIELSISVPDINQYNLPIIGLKLISIELRKQNKMVRFLLEEENWISHKYEGIPLPNNPISTLLFYLKTTSGLYGAKIDYFLPYCHKMLARMVV
jgi:hypothetical protein